MFSNLFVKKELIENYYIADVIFVTNGNKPSYEITKKDRLVIMEKDGTNQYTDVYNGVRYSVFYGIYNSVPCWNTRYKITDKLVNYYSFLESRKITVEEAKTLFENIPKIKLLIEKGNNIEEISKLCTLEILTINDHNLNLIKKRV